MKEFRSFIKKEFRHILRDNRTLLIVFAMPVLLVVLFGFAITTDIKDAKIAILDNSHDYLSVGIANKLISSGYFIKGVKLIKNNQLQKVFRDGEIKLVVVFPNRFADRYHHEKKVQVQLIADASDLNTATTLVNYASTIIEDYQNEMEKTPSQLPMFDTTIKMLYNPEQKGVFMFVPGVLALILMIVSAMMTAISIAREKELRTMRVLTISPLRPTLIIFGKVIPYLIISIINTCLILLLSVFIFGMPINGSILLLFFVCLIFLLTSMSLGVMISAFSDTQQVAVIISIVGLFVPTTVLSGFIYPIANMPIVLQAICQLFPAKWFIEAIKSVMIKGTGIEDIWLELSILIAFTFIFVRISVSQFQKRAA